MTVNELLQKLDISPTQTNKIVKRYQKLGIDIKNNEISEDDAVMIIKAKTEYICLDDHVAKHLVEYPINAVRATSDIRRRLVSEEVSVMKFSDTVFSVTPNTSYIHKGYLSRVEELISEYIAAYEMGHAFDVGTKKKVRKKVEPSPKEMERKRQAETYIGFVSYLNLHPGWESRSRLIAHRQKVLNYMDDHDFFGIKRIQPDEILFESVRNNPFYIRKEDISFLDKQMERFFDEYGLSEPEKFSRILRTTKRTETLTSFQDYLRESKIKISPCVTDTARLLSDNRLEIDEMTTAEVMGLIRSSTTQESKYLLVDFINSSKENLDTSYNQIFLKPKEAKPVEGYTIDQYGVICYNVFNEEHIKEMHMVEKALNDIRAAGMWVYHSVLCNMDVRGTDVEGIVEFMNLREDKAWLARLPREPDKLAEMILNGEIKEDEYVLIGRWFIEKLIRLPRVVSKTNKGEVTGRITPSLLGHFGRLLLIGEVHHMRGQERFLNVKKYACNYYSNRYHMSNFFGPQILEAIGRGNYHRTKMNHTVSQIEEKTARKLGMDSITAMTIAAYSRGHTNIGTMIHYVGDHKLTGEGVEVVLWTMIERRVLGVIPYTALLKAYPEAFGKLTSEEQTKMIALSGLSAMQMEALFAKKYLIKEFDTSLCIDGKEDTEAILRALLAIGQGYGQALDKGSYCLTRALGFKCPKGVRGSCITADCNQNILTAEVLPTLVKAIKEKKERADLGDRKANAVLQSRLMPKFKMVRKTLARITTSEDMQLIDNELHRLLEVS